MSKRIHFPRIFLGAFLALFIHTFFGKPLGQPSGHLGSFRAVWFVELSAIRSLLLLYFKLVKRIETLIEPRQQRLPCMFSFQTRSAKQVVAESSANTAQLVLTMLYCLPPFICSKKLFICHSQQKTNTR